MKKFFYLLIVVSIFLFSLIIYFYKNSYLQIKPSYKSSEQEAKQRILENKDYPKNYVGYPGAGEITKDLKEQLFVSSKFALTRSFFAPIEKKDYYIKAGYEVSHIKPIKGLIIYVVGRFFAWESITNTNDEIIILTDPNNNKKLYKYRVAFEDSPLFGENTTQLAVENITNINRKIQPTNEIFSTKIKDIPKQKFKNLIKKNDIVIITPVFELENSDKPNKKDVEGNMLASWIVLRRLNGKQSIIREIGLSFN